MKGVGFNFFVLIFFSPSFVCFHDFGSPFPCPKLQEVCNPLTLLARSAQATVTAAAFSYFVNFGFFVFLIAGGSVNAASNLPYSP